MNFIFPTAELKQEYSGLIKRADALQKMISERDELLENAKKDGVKISIVAGYDLPLIPTYKRASTQGDSILETALMAGNATVAPYGKTLGDNYNAAVPELVSPDNMIDMSTAKMPECTWLVRNAPHVACLCGSDFSKFIFTLAEAENQPAVDSLSGYSRFMCVDKAQNFIEFK